MISKRLKQGLTGLIFSQFIDYWVYYLGAFACLFGTHYIQSFLPFMAKRLADFASSGEVSVSLSSFLLLALGIIVFRTFSRLLFFYPARVMEKKMRVELVRKLENASPARYQDKYSSGQIFQILSQDMEQIRALIGFALLQVGNIIIASIVIIPKIISFHPKLILAFTPMILSFLLFTFIVSRNRKYYKKVQDLQGDIQNLVIESYNGKKTIKNYHAEQDFINLFDKKSFSELMNFYKAGIGVAVSLPLNPLGLGLSFLWGAYIISTEGLGVSSLIVFSGFIFLFQEPLMFLSWIGVVFSRAYVSWQRIRGLVDELDRPSKFEQELEMKNRNISDDQMDLSLSFWGENLNLSLGYGKWSVFTSKTGHGKTEILTQISEILKIKKESFALVRQDPYLYNDSLEKNIFLGRDPSAEEREEAFYFLKLFGLDYLEKDKEKLLSLDVGENGKRLSGGQAKRLALIRSLMSGVKILIWDDPFSSVDLILEKQIIDNLKKSGKIENKTIILSSHRVSTVKQADYIYLLDKEKGIKEEGLVLDLLSNNNKKSEIYEYFQDQLV